MCIYRHTHTYVKMLTVVCICVWPFCYFYFSILSDFLTMSMYIKLLQKNQKKRPVSVLKEKGETCSLLSSKSYDLILQSNEQGSVFVSWSWSCLDEWHPPVFWIPSYFAFEKLKFRKMKVFSLYAPHHFLGTSLAILPPPSSNQEPVVQSEDWEERKIPLGTEVTCRTGMLPYTSLFFARPGTVIDTRNHTFSGVMKTQRSSDPSPYHDCRCLITSC